MEMHKSQSQQQTRKLKIEKKFIPRLAGFTVILPNADCPTVDKPVLEKRAFGNLSAL